MTELATVLKFPSGTVLSPDDGESSGTTSRYEWLRATPVAVVVGPTGYIPIESLYPAADEVRPELAITLNLLENNLEELKEAESAIRAGESLRSDDAIQRFQSRLPELFLYRSLGEGFASIINAITHSLENMRGEILTERQISALRSVLFAVRSAPFMSFKEAVGEIMELEDNGFVVEPQGFEAIVDWLDD